MIIINYFLCLNKIQFMIYTNPKHWIVTVQSVHIINTKEITSFSNNKELTAGLELSWKGGGGDEHMSGIVHTPGMWLLMHNIEYQRQYNILPLNITALITVFLEKDSGIFLAFIWSNFRPAVITII